VEEHGGVVGVGVGVEAIVVVIVLVVWRGFSASAEDVMRRKVTRRE